MNYVNEAFLLFPAPTLGLFIYLFPHYIVLINLKLSCLHQKSLKLLGKMSKSVKAWSALGYVTPLLHGLKTVR